MILHLAACTQKEKKCFHQVNVWVIGINKMKAYLNIEKNEKYWIEQKIQKIKMA